MRYSEDIEGFFSLALLDVAVIGELLPASLPQSRRNESEERNF
jgi:hypothetical protein